jgi:hypothetical protein
LGIGHTFSVLERAGDLGAALRDPGRYLTAIGSDIAALS